MSVKRKDFNACRPTTREKFPQRRNSSHGAGLRRSPRPSPEFPAILPIDVSTSAPKRSGFLQRLIGAALLRSETYEEVEADRRANGQAVAVVLGSSIAAGFGARGLGGGGAGDIAFFAAVALMTWVAWAGLVYQIGTRLLPGARTRANVGELLRTTAFATAPGLIRIAGVVPGLTIPSFAIAALWMLAAMVVAVRQALDYTSTRRALAVCAFGWVLAITLAVLFGILFGPEVS
jgi:hypothetical protein